MARAIADAAQQIYIDRLPPPMFKALMDYTLPWELLLAHAGPRRRRGVPQEPGGSVLLPVLRREYTSIRRFRLRRLLGSLLDHTGPIAAGERNAARIFGSDETLFVVGGTSTANKIVWHGTVSRGRSRSLRSQLPQIHSALSDHDRRHARSISSRRETDLESSAPFREDQFTPASIKKKIAASPFAKETSGKVRLMVMTNSTYDGLCYNVDAIKES